MTALSKITRIKSFTLYGSLLLLTACGGESYDSAPLQSEQVQRNCIDSNDNSRCESAELESYAQTESDTSSEESENTKSIIASALNNQPLPSTRLLETVNSLTGEQESVLKAPSTSLQTDALTTLLWHEVRNNPVVSSVQEAKNYLTKKLGISWPQGDSIPAAYEQQEAIARQHLFSAQANNLSNNTSSIAIAATVESMIQNRTLDVAADFSLVQSQQLPLSLNGHYQSSAAILSWSYNNPRQELAIAHADRKIEILTINASGQATKTKQLNITAGIETSASDTEDTKTRMLATRNTSAQKIDAFASATSAAPAPAPAPAPPSQPTNPDTGTPSTEARNLSPTGEIQALHLNADNRTGLLLTHDSSQSQSAARACNLNITSHGIFKFDHYLTANNKTPVIAACSQQSLSSIDLSSDGSTILAWDNIAKRLYTVDSQTLSEASSYYLQLNSSLLKMKLSPSAEYAFIAEEEGRRSYIVRIADMQVMIDFSFAGNQVEDVQWLAEGNQLFIASNNEWQLWDTRLAYNPKILNSGNLIGSGKININEDASLIARINNSVLNIYRLSNNSLLATQDNVESVIWNGHQIVTKKDTLVEILSIQSPVSHPIQAAKALLTDSYIAANNASLNNITQTLSLPKNVGELSNSQQSNFQDLEITWSITPELESHITLSGNDQGGINQPATNTQGVLTATINGYFRGDAIRWTKHFNLTIPALP